ncbi:hypothetical protein [Herbidospora mongoliensis]|uniref:hypothetical protein n=1 Tax=Herbidospora mongoliensis TaxID=688067 RepID=UPI00082C8CC9|nr:hypothetical protein [Herbidospora mongoliensis]
MTRFSDVIGLDLSLTGTGVAWPDGRLDVIKTGDLRGHPRLSRILDGLTGDGVLDAADLVVVEGPAYSRALQAGHHENAGLWWHITHYLHCKDIPYAVVGPTALKKYATGKGNATKPDMRVALLTRAGIDERNDNKVDAWWLRAAGLDHLEQPVVKLPAGHREGLAKVEWPHAR